MHHHCFLNLLSSQTQSDLPGTSSFTRAWPCYSLHLGTPWGPTLVEGTIKGNSRGTQLYPNSTRKTWNGLPGYIQIIQLKHRTTLIPMEIWQHGAPVCSACLAQVWNVKSVELWVWTSLPPCRNGTSHRGGSVWRERRTIKTEIKNWVYSCLFFVTC